ncbi:transposase [Candidatus Jettenia caeni]|uniref:Transposase n=1 Tax=Candidatus Jettenia caeni TaxID=247490 RepID=I3IIL9_9BACT|nr:transposase [Candidatus Jettenia caeni]GJQ45091.1 MAG: hypothetical protein JETCAE04_08450 [Candidatus Jettenia caeni]
MERKRYSGEFKAKVAIEAIKGEKAASEIAGEYGVHPTQIAQWKKQVMDEIPKIFSTKKERDARKEEEIKSSLYQQIGQLKVELDWVKKKLDLPVDAKRSLVEVENKEISIVRQCELLGLERSSFYYTPIGESGYNFELMNRIDEQYMRSPFYGVRRMTEWLRQEGYGVNRKRVNRLMRQMGLYAIYPKPRLSDGRDEQKRYPYLLRGLKIEYPNHVWCADITYVKMSQGYVYLVAIMDWYSRYVVSWAVSITLDVGFCIEALDKAKEVGNPEIFNTDQGSQFTSRAFTGRLTEARIKISMDGRGRVLTTYL